MKQLPYIKAVTRAMGLVGVEKAGVESDDLVASQAVHLAAQGHEVLIVSSDKDFAQIVGDRIKLLLPPPSANPRLGWRRLDAAGVAEKFGVPPAQIPDYLALVGDASDNIPGIEGVGPKTAAKWLNEFGSLDELKPERFRESVLALSDLLRRNLKLTTLNLGLPTVAAEKPAADSEALLRLLGELEMMSSLAEARQRYAQAELF